MTEDKWDKELEEKLKDKADSLEPKIRGEEYFMDMLHKNKANNVEFVRLLDWFNEKSPKLKLKFTEEMRYVAATEEQFRSLRYFTKEAVYWLIHEELNGWQWFTKPKYIMIEMREALDWPHEKTGFCFSIEHNFSKYRASRTGVKTAEIAEVLKEVLMAILVDGKHEFWKY